MSPWRLKCQFLVFGFFSWESPQWSVSLRHKARGCEESRYCLIWLSPYFQRYFLNNSTACKRSLFFLLVAESHNPSPRPPKHRGLSKAQQILKRQSTGWKWIPKKPCQISRLQEKSSKTVAVIYGVEAAPDSSCECLCRNGFLHVKPWGLCASLFLIWMWSSLN